MKLEIRAYLNRFRKRFHKLSLLNGFWKRFHKLSRWKKLGSLGAIPGLIFAGVQAFNSFKTEIPVFGIESVEVPLGGKLQVYPQNEAASRRSVLCVRIETKDLPEGRLVSKSSEPRWEVELRHWKLAPGRYKAEFRFCDKIFQAPFVGFDVTGPIELTTRFERDGDKLTLAAEGLTRSRDVKVFLTFFSAQQQLQELEVAVGKKVDVIDGIEETLFFFDIPIAQLPKYGPNDPEYSSPFVLMEVIDQAGNKREEEMSYAQFVAPGIRRNTITPFSRITQNRLLVRSSEFVPAGPIAQSEYSEQLRFVLSPDRKLIEYIDGQPAIDLVVEASIKGPLLSWVSPQKGALSLVLRDNSVVASTFGSEYHDKEGGHGSAYKIEQPFGDKSYVSATVVAGQEATPQLETRTQSRLSFDAYLPAEGVCRVIELRSSILPRTGTGAWVEGPQSSAKLVLADFLGRKIQEIEPTGDVSNWLERNTNVDPLDRWISAARIRGYQGGVIVQDARTGKFFSEGKNMLSTPFSVNLDSTRWDRENEGFSPGKILRVHEWIPFQGRRNLDLRFVGFADLRMLHDARLESSSSNQNILALISFDIEKNGTILQELSPLNSSRIRLGVQDSYLAEVGGRVYALIPEEEFRLGEVIWGADEPRWLDSLPAEIRTIVQLHPEDGELLSSGLAKMTDAFQQLERSDSIMGIYGVDGRLFALFKEAIRFEETAWWLYELSTGSGRTITRFRIPSSAPHLMVIPGKVWAFVEMGRVESIGTERAPFRPATSVLTVPMNRFPSLLRSPPVCSNISNQGEAPGVWGRVKSLFAGGEQ